MDHRGAIEPICDTCLTLDCTNPIQMRNISVLGLDKKVRLYVAGSEPFVVIKCDGYTH